MRQWRTYCDIVGTGANCMAPGGLPLSFDAVVSLIVSYVAVQCGVRMLSPKSLTSVYLPAVVATFRQERVTNEFAAAVRSPEVKMVLDGFTRFYDKNHPQASRLKLAYGMDLALLSRGAMQRMARLSFPTDKKIENVMRERMFVVQAVGIMFMLRRSEHVYAREGTPPLLRRHVMFWDERGAVIPYCEIGQRRAAKVTLNVVFSKTDQSGFGRRPSHLRQPEREEVCIVTILERWVASTREGFGASESCGLYHVPGMIDPDMDTLHEVMGNTVKSLGVEGYNMNVSSHSLRYGGATMMAAAGFPQYLIAHYGGWKATSRSLERYARPSEESIQRVSEFMTKMAYQSPSQHYIQDLLTRQKGGKRGKMKR